MQRRGFVLPSHYSIVPIDVKKELEKQQQARVPKGPKLSSMLAGSTGSKPKPLMSTFPGAKTPRRKNPLVPGGGKYQAFADSLDVSETESQNYEEQASYGVSLPSVDNAKREILQAPQTLTDKSPAMKQALQTSRQASRVLLKSFGHLLDKPTSKFDETLPGQIPSELALLPPPFIDIWKTMDPKHRPSPKVLTSWMAKRGLRMNEAFAERALTDGKCNPPLPPWPENRSKGRESSWLYSPNLDDAKANFDLAGWISHVLRQRGMDAEADDLTRDDGPSLDIRWVVAMLLWLPAAERVSMAKLPFDLKYGFLGFLPLLRHLDLSENKVVKSESLGALKNCTALEIINVSKCNGLTTLQQLNCCRRLTTIHARDCMGFQTTEADQEPMIRSASVTAFDLHECDAVKCLNIECPAVTYLDLAYYDVLERLRGHLMKLEHLDMSFDPMMYQIRDDIFLTIAPNLLELHLRSCDILEKIDGLRQAQKLQVLRVCCCPRLQTLGFDPKSMIQKPICPMLRFLDAHDCPLLLESQLWGILKNLVTAAPAPEGETKTKKKILQRVGHMMPGQIVEVQDFWIAEEEGKKRLVYLCRSANDKKDFLYADQDGEVFTSVSDEEESKRCSVVWPTRAQADKFLQTLDIDKTKKFSAATLAGVRRKLRDAVDYGRDHPELRKEEAKEELDHAITRMIEVLRPEDFALVRSAMCQGAVPELLPDRPLPCFLGCGKVMSSDAYVRHEAYECPNRRTYVHRQLIIPRFGDRPKRIENNVGICMNDVAKFHATADELQAKLKVWNPKPLHDLLTSIDHSSPQYFTEETRKSCWARQRDMEEKHRIVYPLLKHGNIAVDFDQCTVDILVSIAFAARKPPDASAAFEEKGYAQAQEVLKDLSVVVRAYRTVMIVEGHTGQVEPRDYWEVLAYNRSALIVNELQNLGVPRGICKPVGCPGGGAKVLVYPDPDAKSD